MRFNSKEDAWQHWMALYDFHGEDIPGDNEAERMELFETWVDDQAISRLDVDMQEFLEEEEKKYWKGVF